MNTFTGLLGYSGEHIIKGGVWTVSKVGTCPAEVVAKLSLQGKSSGSSWASIRQEGTEQRKE